MNSKRIVWLLLLALLAGWVAPDAEEIIYINASAAQAAEVRVPVLARGADCTAVVRTEDGSVYKTLPLRAEQPAWLPIACENAGSQRFIVSLEGNPLRAETAWDPSVYELAVTAYYRPDGLLDATCTVRLIDAAEAADGKVENLVFSNRPPDETGQLNRPAKSKAGRRPGKSVDLRVQTGDYSALEVYIVAVFLTLFGLLALLRRRVKTALQQVWRRVWSRRINRQ